MRWSWATQNIAVGQCFIKLNTGQAICILLLLRVALLDLLLGLLSAFGVDAGCWNASKLTDDRDPHVSRRSGSHSKTEFFFRPPTLQLTQPEVQFLRRGLLVVRFATGTAVCVSWSFFRLRVLLLCRSFAFLFLENALWLF